MEKTDKIAVISDIHGNFEALTAVLRRIDKMGIKKLYCLGDIIGYGADPNLCIQALKNRNCTCILGNHEDIFLKRIDTSACSNMGKQSAQWTSSHVSNQFSRELSHLPYSVSYQNITMVHSTMHSQGRFAYLNKAQDILEAFSEARGIILYGHTHRPRITYQRFGVLNDEFVMNTQEFSIQKGESCFINIGSVGQQRDCQTDASFAVCTFTDNKISVILYRVPYHSFLAYKKIKHIGAGREIANYLIREDWRKKAYELLDNGRVRLRGKFSCKLSARESTGLLYRKS